MKLGILSAKRTLYSTKRLAEIGRKRGHDVRIINPTQCIVIADEGGLRLQCDGLTLDDFDCIIPRVGASMTRHGLALLTHFELMGTPVVNPAAAITLSRDKLRSLLTLAAHGIGVPPTVGLHASEVVDVALQRVGGPPVILKLLSGTQGIGVIKAETVEQARSTIETLWSLGEGVLVQKFVAESRGHDVRAIVVDDRVVAAMHRHARDDEFRSNLHRGGSSTPAELSAEVQALAVAATQQLGLRVAGVDMLPTVSGHLVIEINSSPGLEGIESTTGRDVARDIIKCAERLAGC